MLPVLTIICILCLLPFSLQVAEDATGVVELDDISFDKVLKKFDVSLIKFDVYYPRGEKHTQYLKIGKDAKYNDQLLIASVGINDFSKLKQNRDLAKKYGVDMFELPKIKLFLKGKYRPITYNETLYPIEADYLRQFVRNNTKVHFVPLATIDSLDKLAVKFINSEDNTRREVILQVGEMLETMKNMEERSTGTIYKTIMDKVVNVGDLFVEKERRRVLKLLRDSVSKEKKKDFMTKLHILDNFRKVPETAKPETEKKKKNSQNKKKGNKIKS